MAPGATCHSAQTRANCVAASFGPCYADFNIIGPLAAWLGRSSVPGTPELGHLTRPYGDLRHNLPAEIANAFEFGSYNALAVMAYLLCTIDAGGDWAPHVATHLWAFPANAVPDVRSMDVTLGRIGEDFWQLDRTRAESSYRTFYHTATRLTSNRRAIDTALSPLSRAVWMASICLAVKGVRLGLIGSVTAPTSPELAVEPYDPIPRPSPVPTQLPAARPASAHVNGVRRGLPRSHRCGAS